MQAGGHRFETVHLHHLLFGVDIKGKMKTVFPKNKLKDFLFKPSQFKGSKSQKKRLAYYEKALEAYQSRGKNTWNWGAFAFGPLWGVYRGMYLWAFVAFLFAFSPNILEIFIAPLSKPPFSAFVHRTFRVVVLFLWGMFGNRMYFKFIIRRYKKGYVCEGRHLVLCLITLAATFPALVILVMLAMSKGFGLF